MNLTEHFFLQQTNFCKPSTELKDIVTGVSLLKRVLLNMANSLSVIIYDFLCGFDLHLFFKVLYLFCIAVGKTPGVESLCTGTFFY